MKRNRYKHYCLLFLGLLLIAPPTWAQEKIGALGRIKPEGDIIHLFGSPGVQITAIHVSKNETVKKGAALAVFSTQTTYQLEMELAGLAYREADELTRKAISVQEARTREIDISGSKAILIQKQKINAARAEYNFSQRRLDRFKKMEGEKYSAQQMDERESQAVIAGAKLESVQQELERLILDRELNLAQSATELERLQLVREINMEKTSRQLKLATENARKGQIAAPVDGTIIEIFQQPGATVGNSPVIWMANLSGMIVVAEVYEGDILKLEPGLHATVTGNSLPEALSGEVKSVGRVIDPSSRTADVVIRLHDPKTAARLINMEVDVSIEY